MNSKEKIYDLTLPWGAGTWQWPAFDDVVVTSTHRHGKDGIRSLNIYTNMHSGTHIDGPVHFDPKGKDIASVSLDRLYGEGVFVDISDTVGEFGIIKPHHITDKIKVKKHDIVIYRTGWWHYSYAGPTPDELTYFGRLPGCHKEWANWAVEMDIKWVGFDTPCYELALNTFMRDYRPDIIKEAEEKMGIESYDKMFPRNEYNIVQKITLPHESLHVEQMGGSDMDKIVEPGGAIRCRMGAFPWPFINGDASICRVAAWVDE